MSAMRMYIRIAVLNWHEYMLDIMKYTWLLRLYIMNIILTTPYDAKRRNRYKILNHQKHTLVYPCFDLKDNEWHSIEHACIRFN